MPVNKEGLLLNIFIFCFESTSIIVQIKRNKIYSGLKQRSRDKISPTLSCNQEWGGKCYIVFRLSGNLIITFSPTSMFEELE